MKKRGRRPNTPNPQLLSRADMERIAALRERGMRWREISGLYGRTPDSLRVSFCKFRAGVLNFKHEEYNARAPIALEMWVEGKTLKEIGKHFGCGDSAVIQFFQRRGWDSEMIVEERALRASGAGSMA